MPFIVRTVQIYVVDDVSAGRRRCCRSTPQMFQQFIEQQGVFVFFVTVYVGAGLIANDRRANALQIYLSKPLLRIEYIGGKLAILVVFLLFVTLAAGAAAGPRAGAVCGQLRFPARAICTSSRPSSWPRWCACIVASFTMLALSSLSKSTRYVAILYTGAIFFTEAMLRRAALDHRLDARRLGVDQRATSRSSPT